MMWRRRSARLPLTPPSPRTLTLRGEEDLTVTALRVRDAPCLLLSPLAGRGQGEEQKNPQGFRSR